MTSATYTTARNKLCVQSPEVEARRREGCIHFITLKKLNRLSHMRLKKARDQTHEVSRRKQGGSLFVSSYSAFIYWFCRLSRKWTSCTYNFRICSMKSCIFKKKLENALNLSKINLFLFMYAHL